jgi:hypothetical protein
MVKIDVEGAEMKVLMGATPVFEKIESMLIEINENSIKYGYKTDDVINLLKNNGFKIYIFTKVGKLKKAKATIEAHPVANILAIKNNKSLKLT